MHTNRTLAYTLAKLVTSYANLSLPSHMYVCCTETPAQQKGHSPNDKQKQQRLDFEPRQQSMVTNALDKICEELRQVPPVRM